MIVLVDVDFDAPFAASLATAGVAAAAIATVPVVVSVGGVATKGLAAFGVGEYCDKVTFCAPGDGVGLGRSSALIPFPGVYAGLDVDVEEEAWVGVAVVLELPATDPPPPPDPVIGCQIF